MGFYWVLLLLSISAAIAESNDSFWRMKTSLVLTSDTRTEGVQICTSMEDLQMKKSDEPDGDSDNISVLKNGLIELVVTNSVGEEVTLYVTEAVYSLLYRRPALRKNPNTFYRPQETEHTDNSSNNQSPINQTSYLENIVYIKKHNHTESPEKLPILQSSNYSQVKFHLTTHSGSFYVIHSGNVTNAADD
ncbi:putative signal peptide-containing protein [Cryptosporidium canis]|uniref:Signal peptide-containing protein n=1 Tax=Cryptosporidium canis TaxID=195482 RepID=A0ABQ8PBX7_9CRYT|nr:putative signal peptide-containing protein [Cryptosporidium canis]KAJ1615456.1 putative signal peptide-containing protein [Cryptosporidium canis]